MLELLIDKKENVKTIMLVENGILLEKHEEHENQKRLEGNIYLGKVQNVLSGMQSAFIDIGEGKKIVDCDGDFISVKIHNDTILLREGWVR